MNIVSDVARVNEEQLAPVEIERVLAELEIPDDDEQLHRARNQRRDRRAAHAQGGRAEVAVNEDIVEADIDAQRGRRDDVADLDNADRAQRGGQHIGQGKEHIGKADDLQILHALLHNGRVVAHQADDLLREEQRGKEHEHGDGHAESQARADDVRDVLEVFFAPVARAQHDDALAHALHQHLQEKLQLIAQRGAGQRILRKAAQHDVIRHVDRIGQQVLQRERQGQDGEGLVKRLFAQHTVHRISPLFVDIPGQRRPRPANGGGRTNASKRAAAGSRGAPNAERTEKGKSLAGFAVCRGIRVPGGVLPAENRIPYRGPSTIKKTCNLFIFCAVFMI